MTDNLACADDCTHPSHRHADPSPPAGRKAPPHAPCAYEPCGKPVVRREGEKTSHFKARLCCSQACKTARDLGLRETKAAEKWAGLTADHPPCVICDKPFGPRPRETPDRFVDRQTCGDSGCIRELIGRKSREQAKQGNTHYNTQRPLAMTGPESVLDFSAGTLRFRPDTRRISKPAIHSYGVSAAWAVRG